MLAGFGDCEVDEGVSTLWVSHLHEGVVVVGDHLADLDTREELLHVFEGHPEGAIVGLDVELELLLEFIGPAIRLVSPVSFPFEAAPRVSKLD